MDSLWGGLQESLPCNTEQLSDRVLYGRTFINAWLMHSEFAHLHLKLLMYLVSAKSFFWDFEWEPKRKVF